MACRLVLSPAGLLIGKSGKDALSGNYDDLLFDASRQLSRRKISGTIGGTCTFLKGFYYPAASTTFTFYQASGYHGLGYIPQYYVTKITQNTTDFWIDTNYVYAKYLLEYGGNGVPPTTASDGDNVHGTTAVFPIVSYVIFSDRIY